MKKLLISSLMAIAIQAQAQNVGIGVAIPTARLHIGGDVKINHSNLMEFGAGIIGKEFNAGKIGYNLFTTDALDITGAGTSPGNRKLRFWAEGGAIFEGGASFVGNLTLANSNLGVRLNGTDNAFITRGFDLFTSGKHNTLGRWGLFMEPNRLTLGVPNITGKGISFSKYNTNSTSEEILSIASDNGAVRRPATGNANLLPIAMGYYSSTINYTGTPNVITGTTNNSTVEFTVAGETLTASSHIIQVTTVLDASLYNGTQPTYNVSFWNGGIQLKNHGWTQAYFFPVQFVIYKLY